MRVALDTNLWSSIGDESAAKQFDDVMSSRSFTVVVPPSTLVEVTHLPVAAARQRIIEALATGRRRRLRTEAALEAADLVAEMRRLRPDWLLRMPDTARVASLDTFWTKKIWREARIDSQRLHDYEMERKGVQDFLVAQQKKQRAEVLKANMSLRPLTALKAEIKQDVPESYLAGWSGEPVDAWRATSRDFYWYQLVSVPDRALLSGEDRTFADWIGAYADLRAIRSDRVGFTRFWLEDVKIEALPRQWLRWAVNLLQSDQKVTRGNPADEQHSSYLVDCDLFLSADARYVSVLEAVRADAPFSFAEPRLVSGDENVPVMERIVAVL